MIKTFQRAGFVKVSQKGSHIKMKGLQKGSIRTVIIPDHKEIARGTFKSILKQAEISEKDFENLS